MSARRGTSLVAIVLACGCGGTPEPVRSTPRSDAGGPTDAATPDGRQEAGAVEAAGPPLVPEASFFDLPPQATAAAYPARMFYAFRPADKAPTGKPLLVFYDGGPGAATSANLLAYGTGPMTLAGDGGAPVPNAASFSRFANLLYLDERQAGFSYGLTTSSWRASQPCAFSILDDAADFVRAIAYFLDAHPPLASAPIVLVGESYGGTRTTAILHLAASHADDRVAMPSDVRSFLAGRAAQFGRAALIQPLVAGGLQEAAQGTLERSDPYLAPYDDAPPGAPDGGGCVDVYDVRHPCGWSNQLWLVAGATLASRSASIDLLGVDLGGAADLLPAARADAFRAPDAEADPSEGAFTARFGALRAGDAYWSPFSCACQGYDPGSDAESQSWLVQVLLTSQLFITNARYDAAIYTPAIPYVFQQAGVPTTIDTSPQAGVARPGWIRMQIPTDAGPSAVTIRFPSYTSSGHMVAVTQGADLADDVEAWLGASP